MSSLAPSTRSVGAVARFHPALAPDPAPSGDVRDRLFVGLLPHYRASGGLATGQELGARIAALRPDGLALLGRQVADGDLLSFAWRGNLWLPLFQFDPRTLALRDAPRKVVAELRPVMDGWALAQWFASPHAALDGRLPVQCIDAEPAAVVDAARLDRFIQAG